MLNIETSESCDSEILSNIRISEIVVLSNIVMTDFVNLNFHRVTNVVNIEIPALKKSSSFAIYRDFGLGIGRIQ